MINLNQYGHLKQNACHSELTHCHFERSEKSQGSGQNRCFVPQHDKNNFYHCKSNTCHSEQREESQGTSQKRCFVPQHDRNRVVG